MLSKFRWNLHGPPPRGVRSGQVYVLGGRGTLYGVHPQGVLQGADVYCSKTTLVGFVEWRHAVVFCQELDRLQRGGYLLDRTSADGLVMPLRRDSGRHGGALVPIRVEKMELPLLESCCLQQFFDMYVVYDLEEDGGSYEFECFEIRTDDPPARPMLTMWLERMLGPSD